MANALYKVNLPDFEGPLDLLLHLIRKNDLDISNIPITTILNQYNEYLALMQELNIDLAGEFILMAAELGYIKSKLLLPDEPSESEDGEDPRDELARRLLEYQRYKDAALRLAQRPMLGRDQFVRGMIERVENGEPPSLQGDTFKLLDAFSKVLKHLKPEEVHRITTERLSVTEQMYALLDRFRQNQQIRFETLFEHITQKSLAVVTFLALLEMLRLKLIAIVQVAFEDPLYLVLRDIQSEEITAAVSSEFDAPLA